MSVKILNIITGGLRREGITTTQLELFKHMNKEGLMVDIAAVFNNEADVIEEFESIGCRVIIFPDRKNDLTNYIKTLKKTISAEKYDVVHVHGSSSLIAIELLIAKRYGIKTRVAHSRNTKTDHEYIDKLFRPLLNMAYTDAFACGVDAGRWLFGRHQFLTMHNGKDLDAFRFSAAHRENMRCMLELNNCLAIGYVGNLNIRQKNLLFLIDIINELSEINPDIHYFLMGDGIDRERITSSVKESKNAEKVHLTGRISNIPDMLQAMDIMLLPSCYEGLPNVVLEWQASGLPCIISDRITEECKVCNLVNYLPIDQGAGVWIDKIQELAEEIVGQNREERSEYGCKCLKENHFDLAENVEFMRNFYLSKGTIT